MRARAWSSLLCVVALSLWAGRGVADDVSASVYVRSDTDGTHVVTPRAGLRLSLIDDRTHVEAGYTADIWTSASIDIRTAATQRITEQRDEINVAVERELADTDLRGEYRFSFERDYVSHGGALSVEQRLAEGNATVTIRLFAAQDTVGRVGDSAFDRGLATVGAAGSYTQVIDPRTLVQATYELARRDGYQASPYRFVGIGGDGACAGSAQLCLPETHPGSRLRHAILVRGRRAFGERLSAGLEYRFYADDWGVVSHTAVGQLGVVPDERSTFDARLRFYRQSGASFYQERYDVPAIGTLRFVSRDRELSTMLTTRLSLSYERAFDLTRSGPTTRATIAAGATLLHYDDFVGLDLVVAVDLTLSAVVEL